MAKHKKETIERVQSITRDVTEPKKTRNIRALIFQSYLILSIAAFTVLAVLARLTPYFKLDLIISRDFQAVIFPGLLPLMQLISSIGYSPQMPIIIIILILLILIIGLRWESVVAGINIVGAALITGILKTLVGRGRPSSDLINVVHNLQDKSFPSGHVLTYTAFFGFLFFLSYTLIKPSILRIILLFIFGGLVILVGPSRIYLGEHWPSDTFGAYLLGSVWLLVTIYLYRWGKNKFFNKQPVAPK